MASVRNPNRPLSPHLQVWKWGPHMLVSILHRATGTGMATLGALLLVWWLAALASGEESYAAFMAWFTTPGAWSILGYVIAVGLTAALFLHMANGIRHLVMDVGANFELRRNKASATAVMTIALLATLGYWAYLIWGK